MELLMRFVHELDQFQRCPGLSQFTMATLDGVIGVGERELVFRGPTGRGELCRERFEPGAYLEEVTYLVQADRGDHVSDPGMGHEITLADEPFQRFVDRRSADSQIAGERVRREDVAWPHLA